jgi:pimeloyl-ACP methyl ester carboxylesterase
VRRLVTRRRRPTTTVGRDGRHLGAALAVGAAVYLGVWFPDFGPNPALAAQQPPAGRTVRVDGAELWYREQGAGEPLVLLHGFLDCGSAWDPFVATLAERYRVIVVELRGHGRSTNPAGTFTMRQSAADVTALLDSLRLPRVHAMGISAGGMTLLHVATRQPERLRSLVLVGATTRFVDQTRAVIRGATRATIPAPVLAEFTKCASRGPAQVDELLAQFQALGRSRGDPDFSPADLARVTAPTLVVHGDRDEFFPVEIALGLYRGVRGSRLWVVPDGDHVPIYDPLVPFADVALRFLRRAGAAGGARPTPTP